MRFDSAASLRFPHIARRRNFSKGCRGLRRAAEAFAPSVPTRAGNASHCGRQQGRALRRNAPRPGDTRDRLVCHNAHRSFWQDIEPEHEGLFRVRVLRERAPVWRGHDLATPGGLFAAQRRGSSRARRAMPETAKDA